MKRRVEPGRGRVSASLKRFGPHKMGMKLQTKRSGGRMKGKRGERH